MKLLNVPCYTLKGKKLFLLSNHFINNKKNKQKQKKHSLRRSVVVSTIASQCMKKVSHKPLFFSPLRRMWTQGQDATDRKHTGVDGLEALNPISKRFQSSHCAKVRAGVFLFFALVPTFSTNSRRNACYVGYKRS